MLHIILLLLKIIGILLLSVLGLILLILLTTLLVPIRYRVAIEHGEKLFYMKGRVNWLLHIVHLNISHIEGILHIQAKLFGFVVYDNLRPKKPKKEKKPRVAEQKTKKSKAANNKVRNSRAVNNKTQVSISSSEKNVAQASVPIDKNEAPIRKTETIRQPEAIKKESPVLQEVPLDRKTENVLKEPKTEHKSFFRKLLERIRGIRDKIVATFLDWKAKLSRIFATASSFRTKLELILNFLRDEMNKDGMHLTFSSIKRLFKHILPTKLKSKLIFGTGDPCSTGQALGAISILYSFYGDRLQITPDFEREVLEGKHFARGRIRLVTILIIVVKLILDKRFKQLKNNFIILKEAL